MISCYDWFHVAPENENKYRSKMLSYFFVSNTFFAQAPTPQFKMESSNFLSESFNDIGHGKHSVDPTSQANLLNISNNLIIYETQEELEVSHRLSMALDLEEFGAEYETHPKTARLPILNRAIMVRHKQQLQSNKKY